MPTLLNVQSSPNLESSASREVSQAFVQEYVQRNPGTTVVEVDLVRNPPPHLGVDHLGAFFASAETHSEANVATLKASDAYIEQLVAADTIVIGTPMHNFGIASVLKTWIDNICRVGKTFRYTEQGPIGLLTGKRIFVFVGSGGVYSDGPFKAYDHSAPYLQSILGLLGLTDMTIIRAEGLALGPEMAEKGLAAAVAAANQAAA